MTFVILATLLVIGTITTGIHFMKRDTFERPWMKYALTANYALSAVLLFAFAGVLFSNVSFAEGGAQSVNGLGLIAAALSTGLATVGTGIAVSSVGSSAIGAISEDPKNLGKTLIFVGLAEGISIFGLLVSIMILGRI
ncbi:ATP synthase subunit C [Guggenheimella bovis]